MNSQMMKTHWRDEGIEKRRHILLNLAQGQSSCVNPPTCQLVFYSLRSAAIGLIKGNLDFCPVFFLFFSFS